MTNIISVVQFHAKVGIVGIQIVNRILEKTKLILLNYYLICIVFPKFQNVTMFAMQSRLKKPTQNYKRRPSMNYLRRAKEVYELSWISSLQIILMYSHGLRLAYFLVNFCELWLLSSTSVLQPSFISKMVARNSKNIQFHL